MHKGAPKNSVSAHHTVCQDALKLLSSAAEIIRAKTKRPLVDLCHIFPTGKHEDSYCQKAHHVSEEEKKNTNH